MSSNTTRATTSCFVCSKPTTNVCSRCLKASFCSPTCQQSSWSSHKLFCASKVHIGLTSAGQTVYASVSVPNPGDIILLEKPLLVSGKIEFDELTKVLDSLPDPKLNAFFNLTSVHNGDTGYGSLSLSEKVKSAKECFNNMALRRKRGANPDPALEHQECVNMYNLQQSIIGILRTNTIPMLPSEPNCSMLCSILCRINHSCEPNATYSYRADFKKSVLVALKPIQEGEEIFVSYIDCWFSRDERLARLKDNFCFDCDCVRCAEDRDDNVTDRGRAYKDVEEIYSRTSELGADEYESAVALREAISIAIEGGIETPFNLKQLHGDAMFFFGEAGNDDDYMDEREFHQKEHERLENICFGYGGTI